MGTEILGEGVGEAMMEDGGGGGLLRGTRVAGPGEEKGKKCRVDLWRKVGKKRGQLWDKGRAGGHSFS